MGEGELTGERFLYCFFFEFTQSLTSFQLFLFSFRIYSALYIGESFCIFFFLFSVSGSLLQNQLRFLVCVCPTCCSPRVDVVASTCCASSRGLQPAPLLNSMERGTPGGAKAELRDIVAATDWARCEGSVVVIRQGNEADLICNDVGGPLDIFSVAVSTNDPASTTLPVGT